MMMHQVFADSTTAVTGEVVETYCWAKLQVGGPAHARCGIECAKRGIPVAVYDSRSRKLFVLLPARDKTPLPPGLIEAMGQQVTIEGEISARGGTQFLTAQSWRLVSPSAPEKQGRRR
jgi:hypothetical protein